ncbi:hypothetical protein EVAR_14775_1 [Eumeta japonica]|uniref:Uncharacterized protein n=1 Tax=Eumeta variegata TaxID=151549 RepID=A0A4C1TWI4_EUMVA|nr:hypothetical protein EVAR_14775_1 [Eumeta japonica]
MSVSGGARRRRRRRPPTASRLKGPRKQKSFAYKLLKRGLVKSFAYKLLKRGLANLMSPTSTSGVAPPLMSVVVHNFLHNRDVFRRYRSFWSNYRKNCAERHDLVGTLHTSCILSFN